MILSNYSTGRQEQSNAIVSAWKRLQIRNEGLNRKWVFQEAPTTFLDHTHTSFKITTETRRQADLLFDEVIRPRLSTKKVWKARTFFQSLIHSAKMASYALGVLAYSRDYRDRTEWELRVIEAAVHAELFVSFRSPPGGPSMSRLRPTWKLIKRFGEDPWTVPDASTWYVELRNRKTKLPIPFDSSLPVPSEVQRKLEIVNQLAAKRVFTARKTIDDLDGELSERFRFSPVLYSVFSDDFNTMGRMFTGKYGYQNLSKADRRTIHIDSNPAVELDYSGMHPRMLYHSKGIDYQDDPYALWGSRTSWMQRQLVKQILNSMINARSDREAVSASNWALKTYAKEGGKKHGKALEKARKLSAAIRATRLTFAMLVPLIRKHHSCIAEFFGSDAGVRLMRTESTIALDIVYSLATRGVSCLPVHDSFIVEWDQVPLLKQLMRVCYCDKFDFLPVVKE